MNLQFDNIYFKVLNSIQDFGRWINRLLISYYWVSVISIFVFIVILFIIQCFRVRYSIECGIKKREKKLEEKHYLIINKVIGVIISSIFCIVLAKILRIAISNNLRDICYFLYKNSGSFAIIILIAYVLFRFIIYSKIKENINKLYYEILKYYLYFIMVIVSIFNCKYIVILSSLLILLNYWEYYKLVFKCDEKKSVELYDKRKEQLKVLNKIISQEKQDMYSIALCGEWGSGKTEFINSYVNEYRSENYFIYIKPTITDSFDSLILQFRQQIIKIMNENGVYYSKNTINKYFNEIAKLIQINSKISLNSFIFSNMENKIYEDYKKDLESDIQNLIKLKNNKKKIILVVDDFDRINEEKQEIILHFIKEIVDFKGCVTIFSIDMNNLLDNKKINQSYVEKFIDRKIELCHLSFKDIIKYHSEVILNKEIYKKEFTQKLMSQIKDNVDNYYDILENKIGKLLNDDDKGNNMNLNKNLNSFVKSNNSRRIIHFLNSIKDSLLLIDNLYSNYSNAETLLASINAAKIIYYLNYIKIFNPEIYMEIVEYGGIEEYRASLNEKNNENIEYMRLILEDVITIERKENSDQKCLLKINNEFRFIKDIFIDYNFYCENIKLVPVCEEIFELLARNNMENLEGVKIDLSILKLVQQTINRKYYNTINEDISMIINNFIKIAVRECNKNISKEEFIELIFNKKNFYRNNLLEFYLTSILLSLEEIENIFTEKDINEINSKLSDLEFQNRNKHMMVFEYFLIILVGLGGEVDEMEIKGIFDGVIYEKHLIKCISDYLISKSITQNCLTKLDDVLVMVERKIEQESLDVIDFDLLKSIYNQYKLNQDLIYKIRTHINNIKEKKLDVKHVTLDELSDYIDSIDKVRVILDELKETIIEDINDIDYFYKVLSVITNKFKEEIDDNVKCSCREIFKNIKIHKNTAKNKFNLN